MTSFATAVQNFKPDTLPINSTPRFKLYTTNWKQDIDDWTTNKGPVRVLATIAVAATTALKTLANLFIHLANAIYSSFYTNQTATPINNTPEPKELPHDLDKTPASKETQPEVTPPIKTQIELDFKDTVIFPPLSNKIQTPRESIRPVTSFRFLKPKTQGELKREKRLAALATKFPNTPTAVLSVITTPKVEVTKMEQTSAPESQNSLQIQAYSPPAINNAVITPLVLNFPEGFRRQAILRSFTIAGFPAPSPKEMLASPQLTLALDNKPFNSETGSITQSNSKLSIFSASSISSDQGTVVVPIKKEKVLPTNTTLNTTKMPSNHVSRAQLNAPKIKTRAATKAFTSTLQDIKARKDAKAAQAALAPKGKKQKQK